MEFILWMNDVDSESERRGARQNERERRVLLTKNLNWGFKSEDEFLLFFSEVERYLYK